MVWSSAVGPGPPRRGFQDIRAGTPASLSRYYGAACNVAAPRERTVPIRRLLQKTVVFSPHDLAAMRTAFKEALRRLGMSDCTDKATDFVARRIVAAAERGERDPGKLCTEVVNSLSKDAARAG